MDRVKEGLSVRVLSSNILALLLSPPPPTHPTKFGIAPRMTHTRILTVAPYNIFCYMAILAVIPMSKSVMPFNQFIYHVTMYEWLNDKKKIK